MRTLLLWFFVVAVVCAPRGSEAILGFRLPWRWSQTTTTTTSPTDTATDAVTTSHTTTESPSSGTKTPQDAGNTTTESPSSVTKTLEDAGNTTSKPRRMIVVPKSARCPRGQRYGGGMCRTVSGRR